ncbi:MAG: right-handed parallel beta-helix repeat-containing protein [Anaerolineae bacterium]|nr:right-handed parallel beta-helix repeat-containing protein [Anaerolineae bacterium]
MSQRSMVWRLLALVCLLLVLASARLVGVDARSVQGETYYVATTGADGPGCGTVGSPCRTVQYAAGLVEQGDTVLINPGTYTGGITVDTSGTASEPITFQANGGGVVIEGSGGERDAFFITWADYIVVEGLTIQHADRAGMRIDNAHHVTVHDCTFANNGTWGLFTDFSDYTTVENCESYGAGDEHGIYISNSSDYPTIRGSRLHHNNGCGLHMNGDINMQPGDGIISYALVEGNVIYENGAGGGSGINMDGVTHSLVRNNLLYDNHASGISIYQIDGGSGSHDNRVLNNTIIMPSDGRWGINIPNTNGTNNKLFNNIVYNYHGWRGSITIASPTLSGFESDYNVLMDRFSVDDGNSRITFAQWQALGYDAHSVLATPAELFADVSADDYHLKAGSPAINAGTLLGDVTDDLEGNPRPVGPTHDAGAYEYQAYGFDLAASPSVRVIAPGEIATYTLSLQPTGGFTATVALTATSPSPDLALDLSPTAVDPPDQAWLTITDTHAGPLLPGVWYTITITGKSQETSPLVVGMNGKAGDLGVAALEGFSLRKPRRFAPVSFTATGGVTQTVDVHLLVGGAQVYLPIVLRGH